MAKKNGPPPETPEGHSTKKLSALQQFLVRFTRLQPLNRYNRLSPARRNDVVVSTPKCPDHIGW